MQIMLVNIIRLMVKNQYLIILKGTKFLRSGKCGLTAIYIYIDY